MKSNIVRWAAAIRRIGLSTASRRRRRLAQANHEGDDGGVFRFQAITLGAFKSRHEILGYGSTCNSPLPSLSTTATTESARLKTGGGEYGSRVTVDEAMTSSSNPVTLARTSTYISYLELEVQVEKVASLP